MNCTTKLICAVVGLFGIGLIVFVYISDRIDDEDDRSGGSSDEGGNNHIIYCTESGCGVVSYQQQSHVHIKGHLTFCVDHQGRSLVPMITKMEMWDDDNFLHGGDDYMGTCDIVLPNFFSCHFIGGILIEGSSYSNVPDIYFKFFMNETLCPSDNPECHFSSIKHLVYPDDHDARDCEVPSAIGSKSTEVDHLESLEPFPYYNELDATWSWTVWKCFANLLLDSIGSQFCNLD